MALNTKSTTSCPNFTEPPITSYKKGKSFNKDFPLNYKGFTSDMVLRR